MIGRDRLATSGPLACCCLHFEGGFSIHCHSADEEEVPVPSKPHMAQGQNNRRLTALRAERHTLTFAERSSCSACHELLCSRAFLFIVLRSAQHPQIPPFFFFFANFPRNLANAPLPPESFRTCFVCAMHAHSHFCPQH